VRVFCRGRVLRCLLPVIGASACGGSAAPVIVEVPIVEAAPLLTTMQVTAPRDSVPIGQTMALGVSAFDHRSRPMTVASIGWVSSNPDVARVGTDGVVVGLAAGVVSITASVGEVTGRRTLVIGPRLPGPIAIASVSVSPVVFQLDVGAARRLATTLRDITGLVLPARSLVWSSVSPSIATVTPDGLITGRATGSATIEVVSEGVRGTAQVDVLAPLDPNIVVTIGAPMAGATVVDTLTVTASVRAVQALDSVIGTVGGVRERMVAEATGALGSGIKWVARPNIGSLTIGTTLVTVNAYDANGKRGVATVVISYDPRLGSGSKPPSSSK
jgi:trimeric autotransporter adhesin